jgi:uncharacterized protein (TIGR00725 family)
MLGHVRQGRYVGVIGPAEAPPELAQLAFEVGERLARSGCIVVCGGLHGVMEAVCRGASAVGGLTVGLLPQGSRGDENSYLSVAIPTGLGELRNGLIVRSSDAVIAIGGSWGTLSEIALAVRTGKPVVALRSWSVIDARGRAQSGYATADDLEELFAFLARCLSLSG